MIVCACVWSFQCEYPIVIDSTVIICHYAHVVMSVIVALQSVVVNYYKVIKLLKSLP